MFQGTLPRLAKPILRLDSSVCLCPRGRVAEDPSSGLVRHGVVDCGVKVSDVRVCRGGDGAAAVTGVAVMGEERGTAAESGCAGVSGAVIGGVGDVRERRDGVPVERGG